MKTFSKATASALAATVADFGSLTFSVQVLHVFYPYGVAIGAFLGALVNFVINRHWAFEAHEQPLPGQALRYAVVSTGSLLLNTFGVYLVTEKFALFYLASKIVIAIGVGVFFNYPLQKYFVYQKGRGKVSGKNHESIPT